MRRSNDPAGLGVILRNLPRAVDDRPLWAQLNVTPRCNLACRYCTEHDNAKDHVPPDALLRRIEKCRELGTLHVDLIGGEPLLHPDLVRLMRAVRDRGMTTGMTTNGFLLDEDRLREIIDAGVGRLQLSVDLARPRPGIPKSLVTLRPKIEMVARHPIWLWVNTVLCEDTAAEVEEIAEVCFSLGASISFSLVHDRGRLVRPADPRRVLATLGWLRRQKLEGRRVATSAFLMDYYERALAGGTTAWSCRGGQKAFYVSPEGRFHPCSHGPAQKDFLDVTPDDLARNRGAKGCEDGCGVDCMLQTSLPYSNTALVARTLLAEKLESLGVRLAGRAGLCSPA